jgi:hypothetical protein
MSNIYSTISHEQPENETVHFNSEHGINKNRLKYLSLVKKLLLKKDNFVFRAPLYGYYRITTSVRIVGGFNLNGTVVHNNEYVCRMNKGDELELSTKDHVSILRL